MKIYKYVIALVSFKIMKESISINAPPKKAPKLSHCKKDIPKTFDNYSKKYQIQLSDISHYKNIFNKIIKLAV